MQKKIDKKSSYVLIIWGLKVLILHQNEFFALTNKNFRPKAPPSPS